MNEVLKRSKGGGVTKKDSTMRGFVIVLAELWPKFLLSI
jgi:hypothetical protein